MTGHWARWLLSLARVSVGAGRGPARLTILRHHRVYADAERPLYRLGVSESVLDRQLALLAEVGLAPVTVGEGLARLASGRPGHVVALTFDDGYLDNATRALPALARHGARATFYLTAGLMESRRAPWWDVLAHVLERARAPRVEGLAWAGAAPLPLGGDAARRAALAALLPRFRVPPPVRDARLAELAISLGVAEPAPCELATWEQAAAFPRAGMEVGGHTLTHPHLTTLDAEDQRLEIGGSVALVRERLGVPCPGFAYPGGDHDEVTVAMARESGVAHAVTTLAGDNRAGAPAWTLHRRGLNEGACLDPAGRFSRRLALAEVDGAFDRLRGHDSGVAA
jgi:peptidoglycan/xylan/chitin deacetylase (PgdA/CDA1 family)